MLICDQSAALDLCDHSILLRNLSLMGVESRYLHWFQSYLSDRKGSCYVDGQLSTPAQLLDCGVPQGSIGGLLLWLAFMCDQPDVVHQHPMNVQDIKRGCFRSV